MEELVKCNARMKELVTGVVLSLCAWLAQGISG
jgi:hypothetical protein